MKLYAEQRVYLIDAQQRQIGKITIERNEDNLIFGKFVPGSDFSAVNRLFQDFEEAANLQALSVVDELDTEIAALGLHLCTSDGSQHIKIHDVQIWSDGDITYRLCDRTLAPVDKVRKSTKPVEVMERSAS
ncbi:hypothetical protein FJZ31_13725 [Candidatus Poribacteria bacterium]|nr:hypothetical protein [Candidatus Poribacteria bacterium]